MKLLKNIVLLTTVSVTMAAAVFGYSRPSSVIKPDADGNFQDSPALPQENEENQEQTEPLTEEELLKSYEKYYQKPDIGIENLDYFINGYPDIIFEKKFDKTVNDWLITVTATDTPGKKDPKGKKTQLYWSEGRFLPKDQLEHKDEYWSLLTYYAEEVRDPVTFSERERDLIREFGYTENRKNAKRTPVFLFDAIYDTATRTSTESHITTIKIFGKYSNVHERMVEPLKRAEAKVKEAAKTSQELQAFLGNIKSCDSYAWRSIEATEIRSLHSLGIAIDFLPRKSRKHLFWGWARDRFPQTWMDVELDARWILPDELVHIFEEEGFVWGGRWVIWDNMHFEYRPEQIAYNKDVFWK